MKAEQMEDTTARKKPAFKNRTSKIVIILSIFSLLILLNISYIQRHRTLQPTLFLHDPNNNHIITTQHHNYDHHHLHKDKLRYIAFGTSVTWGMGVKDRNKQTYIALLNNGKNLGMRASDATYASQCTQTLVGNSATYDVIIIEYERRYESGLDLLIRRLSNRFPNAIIVLIDLWTIQHVILYDEENNSKIPFLHWLEQTTSQRHNIQAAYDAILEEEEKIFLFDGYLYQRGAYMKSLLTRYPNIHLITWDKGESNYHNKKELLLKFISLIHKDFIHLNEAGHEYIAHRVRQTAKRHKFQNTYEVGSWALTDFCSFWYESGQISNTYGFPTPSLSINTTSTTKMNKFNKEKQKFALEILSSSTIDIINPFNTNRILSFTYMCTGPNTTIYPVTRVKIENSNMTKVIEPIVNTYNYPVHVSLTTSIGNVHPGSNTIHMTPLNIRQDVPFRLVGFAITSSDFILGKIFDHPTFF